MCDSQVYPQVRALDSSIESTKTLLQPAVPPPGGQGTVSGVQTTEEDKKTGGGKGGKGAKEKGGKVWPQCAV